MKHDQTTPLDTFAIINALADLASETLFVANAVADINDPASGGLASIMRRWYETLLEVSEALDNAPEGDRAGFSYYVAPSNQSAPGPFHWFVVNNATAGVELHGTEDSWSEADCAAVAAIQELETNA